MAVNGGVLHFLDVTIQTMESVYIVTILVNETFFPIRPTRNVYKYCAVVIIPVTDNLLELRVNLFFVNKLKRINFTEELIILLDAD
jgi:hypothetical protein